MNLKMNNDEIEPTKETPTMEENPTSDEDSDSDSESDSELDEDFDDSNIRCIIGEEAQRRSLDGIGYGLENGLYFVIDKEGAELKGLLVDRLIRRNITDGLLSPIVPTAEESAESADVKTAQVVGDEK